MNAKKKKIFKRIKCLCPESIRCCLLYKVVYRNVRETLGCPAETFAITSVGMEKSLFTYRTQITWGTEFLHSVYDFGTADNHSVRTGVKADII